MNTINQQLAHIIKNSLKIESNPMSIATLFSGRLSKRIKYDPYYQRNYVWKRIKATYFIESILLGTEIPPLIFFVTSKGIEVIDGRQRYETIKRFLSAEDSFKLSEKGLVTLKHFANIDYEHLDEDTRNVFLDTTLRVIEFSIVGEVSEIQEDLIKKEIFRRYNSGITPLKKYEIEKAEYIEDSVTKIFTRKLKQDQNIQRQILEVLYSPRELKNIGTPQSVDKIMMKIRKLLIIHLLPIRYYESAPGKEVAKVMYDLFSDENDSHEAFNNFMNKIRILHSIRNDVTAENPAYNQYIYETLYWVLSVLEQEVNNIDLHNVFHPVIISKFQSHIAKNSELYESDQIMFRAITIGRYEATATFFEEVYDLEIIPLYVNNNGRVSTNNYQDVNENMQVTTLENMRLHKPDAQTITVENLHDRMFRNRRRFLIRPSYQRYESISNTKAAAIIESMLLGIKLPPIFVYKRADGVSEVVDGQQRLLSILGFLGLEFMDEAGEIARAKKHGFRLAKLSILSDLNGKRFEDLSEDSQNKLWDFKLYLVNIDEQVNKNFDPIDLFIRLNNKPYPIKDHTFEMWNSLINRDLAIKIRDRAKANSSWFYQTKNNTRMKNEDLFTALAYLEYKALDAKELDALGIYARQSKLSSRIKSKRDITKVLQEASYEDGNLDNFIKAIKNVDKFIDKLRTILIQDDVDEDGLDQYLEEELNDFIQSTTGRRTNNQFYILWLILYRIPTKMITEFRFWIKQDIVSLMKFIKNTENDDAEVNLNLFWKLVKEIWSKYTPESRTLKLKKAEVRGIIEQQVNVCPICHAALYSTDHIEADHILPLARGGSDTIDNIQIVHWICNRTKGTSL